MTTAATALPEAMTGPRKAATFLLGLGEQVSAEVLKQLTPLEVRRITAEIAATHSIGAEQLLRIFREFESLTVEGRLFAKGGSECARRLVEQAFGPVRAPELLGPPDSPTSDAAGSQTFLEDTDPKQIAMLLKDEHPQAVAVLMATMAPEPAGKLMGTLAEDLQAEVALRLASLDRMSPELFERITAAIGAKLNNIRKITRTDGVRALASVLNRLETNRVDAILAELQNQNATVADSVRSLMFVFEDILTLDKEAMKALLAKLDRKVLTTALKGTNSKMHEHFTQCMSQRAAEMLAEDMEALGPVRIRDVQAAQREVIAAVRQLQQLGTISVGRGTDEYVV